MQPTRKRSFGVLGICLLVCGGLLLMDNDVSLQRSDRAPRVRPLTLPLTFEENQGQVGPQVRFLARRPGYTLFLTPTEIVVGLNRGGEGKGVLHMKLGGLNSTPTVAGLEELPGKSNYFFGNDPKKWRTKIPNYSRVAYEGVYPGVKLICYGNQQQLEFDFILAPGADPGAIQLSFQGANKVEIDDRGDLVLDVAGAELRLRKPIVYQGANGARRQIPGGYILRGPRRVGFQVASYDTARPLVIDPILTYSTYLGGSGSEEGRGIAADSSGNVYVTGATSSADFPVTPGTFQAAGGGCFVAKLNPEGSTLLYSAVIANGGCQAIAVDLAGNAYVTGIASAGFPTTPGAFQTTFGGPLWDTFVTKIKENGTALVYSTYLGGRSHDEVQAIAVDGAGNAYVTGFTSSDNFPTTGGALQTVFRGGELDAFVSKLNPEGTALVYSTYLGGTSTDQGWAITVDTAGNTYVAGETFSSDFPTRQAAFQSSLRGGSDAFVAKLDSTGSLLVYSTYLGGMDPERASGIAVDGAGNAYVTGSTLSANFPTANPFQGSFVGAVKVFVSKLNASASALVYSTYLGGSGNDGGYGIAVDRAGNAHVVGRTTSRDFPTVGASQPVHGSGSPGTFNAFVAALNTAGSALVYSTYLGGEVGTEGSGIALDSSGNVYVSGTTGANFPKTPGAFQNFSGARDAFVAKLAPGNPPPNPAPALGSISPLGAFAGQFSDLTMTVDGSHFVAGSVVRWNGANRITNLVSGAQLQALISSSDLRSVGTARVTVFNPPPGGGTSNALTFTISAAPTPIINAGGVVNGASFAPGLVAGSIASVFGRDLALSQASAPSVPLPTALGETRLRFSRGNSFVSVPLFFVSPNQINIQVPWELQLQTQSSLTATVAGTTSPSVTVNLDSPAPRNPVSAAPGIFTVNQAGSGQGAILIADSAEVAAPTGSIPERRARPARRGEFISIFCTGLGPVNNQPPSGTPASSTQLSRTQFTPTVTIGGVPASVSFSGLAPGFVGLYQVNAQVPANAPTGNAVPVVLSLGGVSSNTVTIAVQ